MTKTLVSNAYQLNRLLEEKYGDRISTDPLETLKGRISLAVH